MSSTKKNTNKKGYDFECYKIFSFFVNIGKDCPIGSVSDWGMD